MYARASGGQVRLTGCGALLGCALKLVQRSRTAAGLIAELGTMQCPAKWVRPAAGA